MKEPVSNQAARSRARDLLSRMTIEEKVGQMCMYPGEPTEVGFDDFTLEQVASDVELYKARMQDVAEKIVAGILREGSWRECRGLPAGMRPAVPTRNTAIDRH